MADIIRVLPDNVANQIAAGEVIQRPASVVKELMENSIDAGSTSIALLLKDAGRTLIQVIDNGKGMSETDARLCFERHATSKIKDINDLFCIRTMGFRGEALASIAAIAQVSLKTKRQEDEVGTHIQINGSDFICQEPVVCANGTTFAVKNLFFNVPARRKFLKSNATELRHVINEFQRLAIANPQVEMSLYHNNTEVYNLPAANLKQRIINIFGKSMNQVLVSLSNDTSILSIKGYVGKPEYAKKSTSEQFFFVNNRYMRHPYFHKAVMNAYENIIPPDSMPSYFIFFDVDPGKIDVNIHPTKTEIKFTDERAIFQILMAITKEVLGKSNFMPAIDFNTDNKIDIPPVGPNTTIRIPRIDVNANYNPFEKELSEIHGSSRTEKDNLAHWNKLFAGMEMPIASSITETEKENNLFPGKNNDSAGNFFQLKNKYVLTPVKSGLMIIDQHRAHERILFERFMQCVQSKSIIAQQNLFPQTVELSADDYLLVIDLAQDLLCLGFDVRDFGNNTVVVHSFPADAKTQDAATMLHNLLEEYKSSSRNIREGIKERIASSLASASAIPYGTALSREEMRELVDGLFACSSPGYTHRGKIVLSIFSIDELEKRFG